MTTPGVPPSDVPPPQFPPPGPPGGPPAVGPDAPGPDAPGAGTVTSQPRRGLRIVLGVVGVLVVCAGCAGVFQLITNVVNQDDLEGLGEPVSARELVVPTPDWEPPNQFVDPQPVLGIRHDLEERVLKVAGVDAPVTSSCDQEDYTGERAATLTCTVTYQDLEVVYEVEARPTGDYTFEWSATTSQTVVTREGILAQFWSSYGPGGTNFSNLRCESFPEVALAPIGEALPQACYAKPEGEKTVRVTVTPQSSGLAESLFFDWRPQ